MKLPVQYQYNKIDTLHTVMVNFPIHILEPAHAYPA